MLIRVPIAAFVGAALWLLEMLLSYYADMFAGIFTLVAGFIASGFIAAVFGGLLLLLVRGRAWERWRTMAWIPWLSLGLGILSAIVARRPGMLGEALDPEFGQFTIYYAHPGFGISAWLLIIVSIVANPWIGFVGSRRWA